MSVLVLGSANLDLVYGVEAIPRPGETVLATRFEQHPGGKGNNQVIAAARAGADARFIAALGADAAGDELKTALDTAEVALQLRRVTAPTGTALITVDRGAENTIVVNSGANAQLLDLTVEESAAIVAADFLLLQLETPIQTVTAAAALAHAAGTIVALNAAPIRSLPNELLDLVDLLIVNEHEASTLATGISDDSDAAEFASETMTIEAAEKVGAMLAGLGTAVIITLGAQGALVLGRDSAPAAHVPGMPVAALDTTGAGDTFCGALLATLDDEPDRASQSAPDVLSTAALTRAAQFATAAAALSVQRLGAVASIPTREEIDDFRRR